MFSSSFSHINNMLWAHWWLQPLEYMVSMGKYVKDPRGQTYQMTHSPLHASHLPRKVISDRVWLVPSRSATWMTYYIYVVLFLNKCQGSDSQIVGMQIRHMKRDGRVCEKYKRGCTVAAPHITPHIWKGMDASLPNTEGAPLLHPTSSDIYIYLHRIFF